MQYKNFVFLFHKIKQKIIKIIKKNENNYTQR